MTKKEPSLKEWNKRAIKSFAIFLIVIIIGVVAMIYGDAAFHESINVSIAKHYGLNSTVTFYLPFTYKNSDYWQGEPNKTSYAISTTSENAIQLEELASTNPSAYNSMNQEFFSNEAIPAQNGGADYSIGIFIAYCVICIGAFIKAID